MSPELSASERYLRQAVDHWKRPRAPETNEPHELELTSLDQAINILGELKDDAFGRGPVAYEKLRNAIVYLEQARSVLPEKAKDRRA